jgi:hypothetical protein
MKQNSKLLITLFVIGCGLTIHAQNTNPAAVDLYFKQSDFDKAEAIISEFIKRNKA